MPVIDSIYHKKSDIIDIKRLIKHVEYLENEVSILSSSLQELKEEKKLKFVSKDQETLDSIAKNGIRKELLIIKY